MMKKVTFTIFILLFFVFLFPSGLRSQGNSGIVSLFQPGLKYQANSGVVAGKVTISGTPLKKKPKLLSPYARERHPDIRLKLSSEAVNLEDAVVYLEHVDNFQYQQNEKVIMDQKDMTIIPHVLPIVQGTTVYFTNHDNIYHNLFSFSRTKKFDLGRFGTDEVRTVTFDRAGVVRVFCDIHSFMSAFIVVLQNPFFQALDSDGSYLIENVPPGNYTIKLWYENLREISKEVEILPGDSVRVNFDVSL